MIHMHAVDWCERSLPAPTAPLRLLPRDALLKTSRIDHAVWNFRPVLGAIQRLRFRFARELLGRRRVGRLLEVGYGSGIFLPELDLHCAELHGVDVHGKHVEVAEKLAGVGVRSRLRCASATALPYPDQHFDRVVAVSSLEFIDDLRGACREIRRVLSVRGRLVVVTPSRSAIADLGLKILSGESAKNDYGDRRTGLIDTLLEFFEVDERRAAPLLYTALSLRTPRGWRALPLGRTPTRRASLASSALGSASIPSSATS
jgi:SAM-dependent methyltransferase